MYFLKMLPLFCFFIQFNICLGYYPSLDYRPEFQDPLQRQIELQRQCASTLPPIFVPLFIPNDKYGNVNYDIIPSYLDFLKGANIRGVILFSEQSDGLLRTQEEKMLLINCFVKEATIRNIRVGVQVGGTDYNDTLALARYAKKAGATAILSRPEVYYAAATTQDVVNYLRPIAKACYPTNFVFSDLSLESGLDYSTTGIVRMLKKKVPNFSGVLTDLVRALQTVAVLGNSDIFVYTADSVDPISPYIYCLNGTTNFVTNIFPISIARQQRAAFAGDFPLAAAISKIINRVYYRCIATANPQMVGRTLLGYKIQIGRLLMWIVNAIDLGNAPAPPLAILTLEQQLQCYYICKREGVAKRDPRDRPGYKYSKYYDNDYDSDEFHPDSGYDNSYEYDYDDD